MIVNNNTVQIEGLGDFFKNLGKKGLHASENIGKNILENPGRALEIDASLGTAFASESPIPVLSSLREANNFYHTGRGLYLHRIL